MTAVRYSLYPLREDFVPLILGAIDGLDRFGVEAETDDLSTCLVGAESNLFAAVRASFGRVAGSGAPVVLRATFSAGEQGDAEGDAHASSSGDSPSAPSEGRSQEEIALPERVNAQFAVYPLGVSADTDTIRAAVERARQSGLTVVERRLCTHLYGRGADVFDTLRGVFATARAGAAHAVMTVTVAANGPSSSVMST